MGDIADMMLEGDLCAMCGVALLNDETPGYPMYCSEQCAKNAGISKQDREHVVAK